MPATPLLTLVGQFTTGTGASFGTGAFTTSSFTPPNNCLLVVFISEIPTTDDASTGTALTIDDTGADLVWATRVQSARMPSWSGGSAIFTAPVGVAQSMTLTADAGAVNVEGYVVDVYAVTDYDVRNPVGANANSTDADGDGTVSVSFSAGPAPTSLLLAHANIVLSGDIAFNTNPGVGWDETREGDMSPRFFQTQTQVAIRPTTTADWLDLDTNGTAGTGAVLVGIEIRGAPDLSILVPYDWASEAGGNDGFVIPRLLDSDSWF